MDFVEELNFHPPKLANVRNHLPQQFSAQMANSQVKGYSTSD
jgi:hypothetical protein